MRYGPLESFDVLHTVPDPEVDGADETFVSLRFARGEAVLRVVWSDGELWTVSDRGALVGATPSVAVQPGRVFLAPTVRDRFLGFDPGTGQRVQVELDRDASGKPVAVELRSGEARIRLGH